MARRVPLVSLLFAVACSGSGGKSADDSPSVPSTGSPTSVRAPSAQDDLATVDEGGSVALDLASNVSDNCSGVTNWCWQ